MSWFAPIMGLIIHLGKVIEAHVVAKRLQACLGMIIEVDKPLEAAKADRNGVVFTRNTKIEPGRTYYVKKGSNVKPFDFKYDGKDFEEFTSGLLQIISAAFGSGVSWQYAFRQLTKSNMASSRAALMQAWRSFRRNQINHERHLRTIIRTILAEDIARGRLDLPSGTDLDAAADGYFVPPQRLVTDEHREMQAAEKKKNILKVSETTLNREYGYDRDAEREQQAEDQAADDDAGIAPNADDIEAEQAAADLANAQYNRDNPDDDDEENVDDTDTELDAAA